MFKMILKGFENMLKGFESILKGFEHIFKGFENIDVFLTYYANTIGRLVICIPYRMMIL